MHFPLFFLPSVKKMVIFAPLFRKENGAADFIEKKASFRLSVSVNLDNSRMLVRISEIKLACEYSLPNTNRWGLFFSILLTGSPDPTEWMLSN